MGIGIFNGMIAHPWPAYKQCPQGNFAAQIHGWLDVRFNVQGSALISFDLWLNPLGPHICMGYILCTPCTDMILFDIRGRENSSVDVHRCGIVTKREFMPTTRFQHMLSTSGGAFSYAYPTRILHTSKVEEFEWIYGVGRMVCAGKLCIA